MDRNELEQRSIRFAKSVLAYADAIETPRLQHAVQQLLRSSSGAAANYRSAGRARSRKEFIAKLGVVNEEADETVYWLEYIESPTNAEQHEHLLAEARELRAIFAAAYGTAKRNSR
jgi:four helix bundle protein